VRAEITLPEETLDKYVGNYRLAPQVTFIKIPDAQFSFVEDAATGKDGRDMKMGGI